MAKESRGRKLKEHCSRCGIKKTSENTYTRKNGYLLNVCKACNSKISKEKRFLRMPKDKQDKILKKYKEYADILKKH